MKQSGFTLVEVMITLCIIAILSAIAIPAYQKYAMRARRSEAKIAVMAVAQALEKYRAANNTYVSATLGGTSGIYPNVSDGGDYKLSFSQQTASQYTVVATATGRQANDTECTSFSLNDSGVKSAKNAKDSDSANCW